MRDGEIDFVGRMIAAVSHEFMNVLATIRESSGLMEDLLALDDTGFPHRDRLMKTFATTRRQVSRGMEIGEHLNAFAHNMDQPKPKREINALLLQIAFLMERFARFKQMQLKIQPADSPLEIETDPFRLQWVIARCVESCIEHTANGGRITLQCRQNDREVTLGCQGEPLSHGTEAAETLDPKTADLNDTLQRLGAELSSFSTGARIVFAITLPHPSLG